MDYAKENDPSDEADNSDDENSHAQYYSENEQSDGILSLYIFNDC